METEKYQIDEQLSLTNISMADLDSICLHINDKTVYENTVSIPYPYTEQDGMQYISNVLTEEQKTGVRSNYAIKYEDQMIGGIGLLYNYGLHSFKSEIGYWLSAEFRNKGLMSKVLRTFNRICFEEKQLFRLEANVFLTNKASQRLLEKNGFQFEGILRNAFIKDGAFRSTMLFALLKEDWKRSR